MRGLPVTKLSRGTAVSRVAATPLTRDSRGSHKPNMQSHLGCFAAPSPSRLLLASSGFASKAGEKSGPGQGGDIEQGAIGGVNSAMSRWLQELDGDRAANRPACDLSRLLWQNSVRQ